MWTTPLGRPMAGDVGSETFPSLPTECTIHPRVSEHRGHCRVVIIIQNHAVAEPDARVTWGHSQVLEGDGRGDDNLKGGGGAGERWEGREEGGGQHSPPQTQLHLSCAGRGECYLISTPGSIAPLPDPQLQPLQGSWVSENEALIPANVPRPPPPGKHSTSS